MFDGAVAGFLSHQASVRLCESLNGKTVSPPGSVPAMAYTRRYDEHGRNDGGYASAGLNIRSTTILDN